MPHPLPALAAFVAAPLLGLAVHVASTHAAGTTITAAAAASLPKNLCSSCHGGGRVAWSRAADALDARDLVAARSYLEGAPRG
ncbi:hypothetical protein ACFWZ4_12740 [Frateuria sp. GZRe12]|uniref:hypothetical protein n=1 Tax=Frateuria sp. GZRe12 TaxID=3351533 RepID=UPI003EDC486F